MAFDFRGTGVAIVTPFNDRKLVDYPALERLVDHIIRNKVEYIVVLGTTGESVTLKSEEKRSVVEKVIETNKNRVPIVLGIGGNNTADIIENMHLTDTRHIDAILSVSPYYNKPTQEGIYQHYKTLDDETPKPIILYNVPPRTGSNMSAETTLRIAHDCKNIKAIKEASGDLVQAMTIIRDKPEGFHVISGEDLLTLPMISAGGDGVISVVANAFPLQYSTMVRDALDGNFEKARENHYPLMEVTKYLFTEGNPGGVKAALKVLGITGDDLRLPLWNVSDHTFRKIKELTGEIKG